MPDYVTIKLYADTRKAIRLIAAETGEQMVQVMDRLCQEELAKIARRNTERNTNALDRNEDRGDI
jgi:hypothetical protein